MATPFSNSTATKLLFAAALVTGVFLLSFTFKTTDNMDGKVKTLIYHKVQNFDTWKATFDGAKDFRRAAGELSYEIGTLHHDPSVAYVLNEWSSAEAFKAFMAQPDLANAMKQAGVLEPPTVFVFEEKARGN